MFFDKSEQIKQLEREMTRVLDLMRIQDPGSEKYMELLKVYGELKAQYVDLTSKSKGHINWSDVLIKSADISIKALTAVITYKAAVQVPLYLGHLAYEEEANMKLSNGKTWNLGIKNMNTKV